MAEAKVAKEMVDFIPEVTSEIKSLSEKPKMERPYLGSHLSGLGPMDGTDASLRELFAKIKELQRTYHVQICFKDLGYWITAPPPSIPTVGTTMKSMMTFGMEHKERMDILKNLTGMSSLLQISMNFKL
jgi:hypothetical protein